MNDKELEALLNKWNRLHNRMMDEVARIGNTAQAARHAGVATGIGMCANDLREAIKPDRKKDK